MRGSATRDNVRDCIAPLPAVGQVTRVHLFETRRSERKIAGRQVNVKHARAGGALVAAFLRGGAATRRAASSPVCRASSPPAGVRPGCTAPRGGPVPRRGDSEFGSEPEGEVALGENIR